MNKKGEGGIGFWGVILALILFFMVRSCSQSNFQDDINNFCTERGFDYGEETIRDTVIECRNFNNTDIEKIPYGEYDNIEINLNQTNEVIQSKIIPPTKVGGF